VITLFCESCDGHTVPCTLLAFDDTDSPDGMCTTYLATLVLEELRDFDLIGLPRLVRLNPNIPWKTRGNAAICLPMGRGIGRSKVCGSINGSSIRYFPRGHQADPADLLSRASRVLESVARFECEKTNPGIVGSNSRPPPSLYWKAVRGLVSLKEVETMLMASGAVWRKYKSGRGIIGASAAMSWRPRDRTWEVIAYRAPPRWGTPREIDPRSVIRMDKRTKMTFNNYDYENCHVAIAPGSPCPILFGIRGDSSAELLNARTMIRGEVQDRWLMFLTNQATEDHIMKRSVASLRKWESARVRVRIAAPAKTIPGGHVIVRVSDGDEIDAAFYEPSKQFRSVARALLPGDEVTLLGSVRDIPRSLNVEKMAVRNLVEDTRKVRNPVCAKCRKSMGSLGSGQGFRCKNCGSKSPRSAATYLKLKRDIKPGWYEPPVASRRHLHKPIRRMSKVNIDKL
jgi:tRNA(Ile2)-agmatinylcytidine synthase